ncbi:hypothetical protein JTE90_010375 [Oedothorax gibbosus]|uniref:DEK-C domain-containing protein n=1 Tax=Oedothorax gibbosus TaxID=931172 RepID=A0AAV6VZ98_9ARAC|nr:hypothetical protein JTE90_010375 [Oedothorax gibbosus]
MQRQSSVKEEEENSSKTEDTKTDESSKDSFDKEDKVDEKEEANKEESDNDKGDSEKDESEEESEEEGIGLLDRPVEVSGCRARKKVERLEVSFTGPSKEKGQIPEGKGKKLGECPRIELQIQKTSSNDLKPLHRLLFNRAGGPNEIKRNIRKFSGFTFAKDSSEYDKLKSRIEKLTGPVLKQICGVCDIERSGLKEEIVKRVLQFLMEPKDSGKAAPKKKTKSKDKKKSGEKATKNKAKKEKVASSDDESETANDSVSAKSSDDEKDKKEENDTDDDDSDSETSKKKSKPAKKSTDKKEKDKKEDKASKRKRDEDSDDSDDKTPASKKKKGPSDEELKNLVKKLLKGANLQEVTMKKVIKQVADAYPSVDLSHKKAFLKATVKTTIHG